MRRVSEAEIFPDPRTAPQKVARASGSRQSVWIESTSPMGWADASPICLTTTSTPISQSELPEQLFGRHVLMGSEDGAA
jgi:hypothetical protein